MELRTQSARWCALFGSSNLQVLKGFGRAGFRGIGSSRSGAKFRFRLFLSGLLSAPFGANNQSCATVFCTSKIWHVFENSYFAYRSCWWENYLLFQTSGLPFQSSCNGITHGLADAVCGGIYSNTVSLGLSR